MKRRLRSTTAAAADPTPATRRFGWQILPWMLLLALSLAVIVRTDLAQLRWVSELSMQGSPPPALDPRSPTGYALGQRHFLGSQERGESYRWIAATQELAARGPFAAVTYTSDSIPTGRPMLLPRLYAAWIGAVAYGLHLFSNESFPVSVERAALWEPLISHVLAFAAAVGFMARRYGLVSAAVAGLFFAFFPPLAGQFFPGVLTARTWALLFAAAAIAANLPRPGREAASSLLNARSAIAASAALWLDPALGFPAVLLSAAAAAIAIARRQTPVPGLRWSLIGAALTLAGWLLDRAPWDPAAGELRYVHPLYAAAWLGLGLALDAAQQLRASTARSKRPLVELAAAAPLVGALLYVQFSHAFKGWLYPSVWIRRITSNDESLPFESALDWIAGSSFAEILFLSTPLLAVTVMFAVATLRRRPDAPPTSLWPALALWLGVLAFSFFRVRWGLVAFLVALPLFWHVTARDFLPRRRIIVAAAASFLFALVAWSLVLSPPFQNSVTRREPTARDLDALVYRHFAHWLATHTPAQSIAALAPPELADSLVFHAGGRVLMSTAWESYPGQLATTRILSSLEATEAEAVLQGHGVTHVILPSWDKVLPVFVRKPAGEIREPLFERLQRWLHPPYLRPLPYRLPSLATLRTENLAVFKVTPVEDEALSLGRLAEYFVEMERPEPAALAARVLAESFPDDPNAAIARATVYAQAKQTAELHRELDRLAADIAADRTPFLWDRRVQRAIVLALGRRNDLVRSEVEACLASATRDDVYELTPLQAYRLETLARRSGATFSSPELAEILVALGAELAAAPQR